MARIARNKKAVIATELYTGEVMKFDCMAEAAKELGVCSSAISLCCSGKIRRAHGYEFEYADREKTELKENEAKIILAMAECNLNMAQTARKLYMCRNTIAYDIQSIKGKTGKDPRKFYDMCELLPMAKAVLECE